MASTNEERKKYSVLEYPKRIAKSITFGAFEAIAEEFPVLTNLVTSNTEAAKEVYDNVFNVNRHLTKLKSLQDKLIFKPANMAIENFKESLSTGEFYNTARKEMMDQYAAGLAMEAMMADEMDEDTLAMLNGEEVPGQDPNGTGNPDVKIKGIPEVTKGDTIIASVLTKEMRTGTNCLAKAVSVTTDATIQTVRTLGNLILEQNQQHSHMVKAGFNEIISGINGITQFNENILLQHAKNSLQFYDTMANLTQENNAILKEMVEMQRNLYSNTLGQPQSGENGVGNVFANGGFNLKDYVNVVTHNINNKSFLGPLIQMIPMVPMLIADAVANPLHFLTKQGMKTILGPQLRLAMNDLDASFMSYLKIGLAKLSQFGKTNKQWSFLGQIFGYEPERTHLSTVDTSKLGKGARQWDMDDHLALTKAIPMFLSNIEAALTGNKARYYNFDEKRFKSIVDVEQAENRRLVQDAKMAGGEAQALIEQTLSTLFKPKNDEELVMRNKALTEFFTGMARANKYDREDIEKHPEKYGGAAIADIVLRIADSNKEIEKKLIKTHANLLDMADARASAIRSGNLTDVFSDAELTYAMGGHRTKNQFNSNGPSIAGKLDAISVGTQTNIILEDILKVVTDIRDHNGGGGGGNGGPPNNTPPNVPPNNGSGRPPYNPPGNDNSDSIEDQLSISGTQLSNLDLASYGIDESKIDKTDPTNKLLLNYIKNYQSLIATRWDRSRYGKSESADLWLEYINQQDKAIRLLKSRIAPAKTYNGKINVTEEDMNFYTSNYMSNEANYDPKFVQTIDWAKFNDDENYKKNIIGKAKFYEAQRNDRFFSGMFGADDDQKDLRIDSNLYYLLTRTNKKGEALSKEEMQKMLNKTGDYITSTSAQVQEQIQANRVYANQGIIGQFLGLGGIDNKEYSQRIAEATNGDKNLANADIFTQLANAADLGSKFAVINANIDEILKAPRTMLSTVIKSADSIMYDFFFNKESEVKDKNGKPVKGLFNRMMFEMGETMEKLNSNLDDIFSNKGDWLGKLNDTINNWFGINIKESYKKGREYIKEKVINPVKKGVTEGARDTFDEISDAVTGTIDDVAGTHLTEKNQGRKEKARREAARAEMSEEERRADILKERQEKQARKEARKARKKRQQEEEAKEASENTGNAAAGDTGISGKNFLSKNELLTGNKGIYQIEKSGLYDLGKGKYDVIPGNMNPFISSASRSAYSVNANKANEDRLRSSMISRLQQGDSNLAAKLFPGYAEGTEEDKEKKYHEIEEERSKLLEIASALAPNLFNQAVGEDGKEFINMVLEVARASGQDPAKLLLSVIQFAGGLVGDAGEKIGVPNAIKKLLTEEMIKTHESDYMQENDEQRKYFEEFMRSAGYEGKFDTKDNVLNRKFESRAGVTDRVRQFMHTAFGTDPVKAADDTRKYVTENTGDILKGGVGGALASLVFPLGGPLMGAIAGASAKLLSNNSSFMNYVFGTATGGEEDVLDKDGKPTGRKVAKRKNDGLFGNTFLKTLAKYAPDAKKYGIAGIIAGSITPLGPLGGVMAGLAASWIKNNKKANDFIFGDEGGILNKDRKERIKKALPAIGASVLATMFLGPFGLMGNAVLGSALGMLSTTEYFKRLILGSKGKDGSRHGGLAGAIRAQITNPFKRFMEESKKDFRKWWRDEVFKKLSKGISPIAGLVKDVVKDAGKSLLHFLDRTFNVNISGTLEKWMNKGLAGLRGGLKNLIYTPFKWIGKNVIGKLAQKVEDVGSWAQAKRLANGTIEDTTATDRLELAAKQGNMRYAGEGFDRLLAGMHNEGEIKDLASSLSILGQIHDKIPVDQLQMQMQDGYHNTRNILAKYNEMGRFDSSEYGNMLDAIQKLSQLKLKNTDDPYGDISQILQYNHNLKPEEIKEIKEAVEEYYNFGNSNRAAAAMLSNPKSVAKSQKDLLDLMNKQGVSVSVDEEELMEHAANWARMANEELKLRAEKSEKAKEQAKAEGRIYDDTAFKFDATGTVDEAGVLRRNASTLEWIAKFVNEPEVRAAMTPDQLAAAAGNMVAIFADQAKYRQMMKDQQAFKDYYQRKADAKEKKERKRVDTSLEILNANETLADFANDTDAQNAVYNVISNADGTLEKEKNMLVKDLELIKQSHDRGNKAQVLNIAKILDNDEGGRLMHRIAVLTSMGLTVPEDWYEDLQELSNNAFNCVSKLVGMGYRITSIEEFKEITDSPEEQFKVDALMELAYTSVASLDGGEKISLSNFKTANAIYQMLSREEFKGRYLQNHYQKDGMQGLVDELTSNTDFRQDFTKKSTDFDDAYQTHKYGDEKTQFNYETVDDAYRKIENSDVTRITGKRAYNRAEDLIRRTGNFVGGVVGGVATAPFKVAQGVINHFPGTGSNRHGDDIENALFNIKTALFPGPDSLFTVSDSYLENHGHENGDRGLTWNRINNEIEYIGQRWSDSKLDKIVQEINEAAKNLADDITADTEGVILPLYKKVWEDLNNGNLSIADLPKTLNWIHENFKEIAHGDRRNVTKDESGKFLPEYDKAVADLKEGKLSYFEFAKAMKSIYDSGSYAGGSGLAAALGKVKDIGIGLFAGNTLFGGDKDKDEEKKDESKEKEEEIKDTETGTKAKPLTGGNITKAVMEAAGMTGSMGVADSKIEIGRDGRETKHVNTQYGEIDMVRSSADGQWQVAATKNNQDILARMEEDRVIKRGSYEALKKIAENTDDSKGKDKLKSGAKAAAGAGLFDMFKDLAKMPGDLLSSIVSGLGLLPLLAALGLPVGNKNADAKGGKNGKTSGGKNGAKPKAPSALKSGAKKGAAALAAFLGLTMLANANSAEAAELDEDGNALADNQTSDGLSVTQESRGFVSGLMKTIEDHPILSTIAGGIGAYGAYGAYSSINNKYKDYVNNRNAAAADQSAKEIKDRYKDLKRNQHNQLVQANNQIKENNKVIESNKRELRQLRQKLSIDSLGVNERANITNRVQQLETDIDNRRTQNDTLKEKRKNLHGKQAEVNKNIRRVTNRPVAQSGGFLTDAWGKVHSKLPTVRMPKMPTAIAKNPTAATLALLATAGAGAYAYSGTNYAEYQGVTKDIKQTVGLEENLFKGEDFGLTDLTPEEQAKANYFTQVSGDPSIAYNSIVKARELNGGNPVHTRSLNDERLHDAKDLVVPDNGGLERTAANFIATTAIPNAYSRIFSKPNGIYQNNHSSSTFRNALLGGVLKTGVDAYYGDVDGVLDGAGDLVKNVGISYIMNKAFDSGFNKVRRNFNNPQTAYENSQKALKDANKSISDLNKQIAKETDPAKKAQLQSQLKEAQNAQKVAQAETRNAYKNTSEAAEKRLNKINQNVAKLEEQVKNETNPARKAQLQNKLNGALEAQQSAQKALNTGSKAAGWLKDAASEMKSHKWLTGAALALGGVGAFTGDLSGSAYADTTKEGTLIPEAKQSYTSSILSFLSRHHMGNGTIAAAVGSNIADAQAHGADMTAGQMAEAAWSGVQSGAIGNAALHVLNAGKNAIMDGEKKGWWNRTKDLGKNIVGDYADNFKNLKESTKFIATGNTADTALISKEQVVVTKIKDVFNKVANNIKSFIPSERLANAVQGFGQFLFKKLENPSIIKRVIAAVAKSVGGSIPGIGQVMAIGMGALEAYAGWNNAEAILKIPKGSATDGMKLMCALISALTAAPWVGILLAVLMGEAIEIAINTGLFCSRKEIEILRKQADPKYEAKEYEDKATASEKQSQAAINATKGPVGEQNKKLNQVKNDKNNDPSKVTKDDIDKTKPTNNTSEFEKNHPVLSAIGSGVNSIAKGIYSGLSSGADWINEKKTKAWNWITGKNGQGKYGRANIPDYNQDNPDDSLMVRTAKAKARMMAAMSGQAMQDDPSIANMSMNIPGDTEKQTALDSACGPVSAFNLINSGSTNNNSNQMQNMIKQSLHYKAINDGIRPEGIKNLIDTNSNMKSFITTNQSAIMDNISTPGSKGVFMGGGASAYGAGININDNLDYFSENGQHYVKAENIGKIDNSGKNVIEISDPDRDGGIMFDYADNFAKRVNTAIFANENGQGKYGRTKSNTREIDTNRFNMQYAEKYGRTKFISKPDRSILRNAGIAAARGKSILYGKAKSKYGRRKGGSIEGVTKEQVLNEMLFIAAAVAKKVGSKHPELFFGQMINETGGPENYINACKKYNTGFDHNYGGFTWYEGMGEEYKGVPRPKSEGGYYATFDNATEYANLLYEKVFKRYASELAKAETPEEFAQICKNHGYYSDDDVSSYAANIKSAIKQYENELKNIGNIDLSKIDAGSNNSNTNPLNSIFGFLGAIADKLNLFSSSSKNNSGSNFSSSSSEAGIKAASEWAESMVGKQGYGNNGCTTFVREYLKKAGNPIGEYMEDGSPIADQLKQAAQKAEGNNPTLMWVPTLEQWAKDQNIFKPSSGGGAEGDICVCNDHGHVVIADGKGGCWGNSSSKNQIVHYDTIDDCWKSVEGYVATGAGQSVASKSTGNKRSEKEMLADAGSTNAGAGKYGRAKELFNKLLGRFKTNNINATTDISGGDPTLGLPKSFKPSISSGQGKYGRYKEDNIITDLESLKGFENPFGADIKQATESSLGITPQLKKHASILGKGKSYGRAKHFGRGTEIPQAVWNYFEPKYGPVVTAAIMGNMSQESSFNPKAVSSDGNQSIGLAQWTFDRKTNLKKFAESKGTSWEDVQTQLEFLDSEIKSNKRFSNAIEKMKSQSVEDATVTWEAAFEGSDPKYTKMDKRKNAAKAAFEKKGAIDGANVSSSSSSSGGMAGGLFGAIFNKVGSIIDRIKSPVVAGMKAFGGAFSKILASSPLGKMATMLFGDDNPLSGLANMFSGTSSSSSNNSATSNGPATVVDAPLSGSAAESMLKMMSNPPITSHYGPRGSGFHSGIDIGVGEGTQTPTPVDGVIDDIGTENGGYGKYVVVKDNKGNYHIMGHLSDNNVVSKGQNVTAGTIIAKSGNTGHSSGPHIHYGIYPPSNRDCAGKSDINPETFKVDGLASNSGKGKYGRVKRVKAIRPTSITNGNDASSPELNDPNYADKSQVKYGRAKNTNPVQQKLLKRRYEQIMSRIKKPGILETLMQFKAKSPVFGTPIMPTEPKLDNQKPKSDTSKGNIISDLFSKFAPKAKDMAKTILSTKVDSSTKVNNKTAYNFDDMPVEEMLEIYETLEPEDINNKANIPDWDNDSITVIRAKMKSLFKDKNNKLDSNKKDSTEGKKEPANKLNPFDLFSKYAPKAKDMAKTILSTKVDFKKKVKDTNNKLNAGADVIDRTTNKTVDFSKIPKAPNGKEYTKNDIEYLLKNGYSLKDALDLLSKDKRYAVKDSKETDKKSTDKDTKTYENLKGIDFSKIPKAPNGKEYTKNDISYLIGKGYTLESAIKLLSEHEKYAKKEDKKTTSTGAVDNKTATQKKAIESTTDNINLKILEATNRTNELLAALLQAVTGNYEKQQQAAEATVKQKRQQNKMDKLSEAKNTINMILSSSGVGLGREFSGATSSSGATKIIPALNAMATM